MNGTIQSRKSTLRKYDYMYVCCIFPCYFRHDMDMRRVKEVQGAAEKLRREKWIDEKTKKIKVHSAHIF